MSAQVSNLTMAGSATRLSRALSAAGVVRQQVDGVESTGAAPARDEAGRFEDYGQRYQPAPSPRRPEGNVERFMTFGGILVSREVGATMMQTQAMNGFFPPLPSEAVRQIANYEFAQSLMGPPQVMPSLEPFPQQATPEELN